MKGDRKMGWLNTLKNVATKIMTVVRIYDIINPKARIGQKVDKAIDEAEDALKPVLEKLEKAEERLTQLRALYDLVFSERTPESAKAIDTYKAVDEVTTRMKSIATEKSFYIQHLSNYLDSQQALARDDFAELRKRFEALTQG